MTNGLHQLFIVPHKPVMELKESTAVILFVLCFLLFSLLFLIFKYRKANFGLTRTLVAMEGTTKY